LVVPLTVFVMVPATVTLNVHAPEYPAVAVHGNPVAVAVFTLTEMLPPPLSKLTVYWPVVDALTSWVAGVPLLRKRFVVDSSTSTPTALGMFGGLLSTHGWLLVSV
jgi:hypothetical protein